MQSLKNRSQSKGGGRAGRAKIETISFKTFITRAVQASVLNNQNRNESVFTQHGLRWSILLLLGSDPLAPEQEICL